MPGADDELVRRLQAGDEAAFAEVVDRFHGRLVRLARSFVRSQAAAEDVAQETWVAVIRGVARFEGRSSLQTWLLQICVNRARSHGAREQRAVPVDPGGPTVPASRFDAKGAWADPPDPWSAIDDRLEAKALAPLVRSAIDELPDSQRQVVTLRDIEGLSGTDVCDILSLSEANQRVLLHRGRARVRAELERTLRGR